MRMGLYMIGSLLAATYSATTYNAQVTNAKPVEIANRICAAVRVSVLLSPTSPRHMMNSALAVVLKMAWYNSACDRGI